MEYLARHVVQVFWLDYDGRPVLARRRLWNPAWGYRSPPTAANDR